MGHTTTFVMLTIAAQVFAAPQFITFKEGKVGVNFGGYHAAAGLGGLFGGGGAGGLFAEAGTPYGQAARAGLGGASSSGGSGGGLYAGATAGGDVGASAGLAGGVDGEKAAGVGYAGASAGGHRAAAGLGGDSGAAGSSGFTYSGSKTFGVSGGAVEQPIKPVHKKVHKEFNFDAANEVNAVPLKTNLHQYSNVDVEVNSKPAVDKEVSNQRKQGAFYSDHKTNINFEGIFSSLFRLPEVVRQHKSHFQQPFVFRQPQKVYAQPHPVVIEKHYIQEEPVVVEKHIHHKRPHRYHNKIRFHGYVGGAGAVAPPPIEKRVDVGVESSANAGAYAHSGAVDNGGAGQVSYTKQVNFQRNPQFFADIFNIPISTLKAVGSFLGNAAGSTSVSVQKSASAQAGADSDTISPKHGQSLSSSQAEVSIKTPDASKFIEDIFAIPINTLGAVNKFLENNVPARKQVQISADGAEEPARFRLGPHARRRATKQVIIQTPEKTDQVPKESE